MASLEGGPYLSVGHPTPEPAVTFLAQFAIASLITLTGTAVRAPARAIGRRSRGRSR